MEWIKIQAEQACVTIQNKILGHPKVGKFCFLTRSVYICLKIYQDITMYIYCSILIFEGSVFVVSKNKCF